MKYQQPNFNEKTFEDFMKTNSTARSRSSVGESAVLIESMSHAEVGGLSPPGADLSGKLKTLKDLASEDSE